MSEYIERDVAVRVVTGLIEYIETLGAPENDVCALRTVTVLLGSVTAGDVVEVVRCKDCKYWNRAASACDTLPWVNSFEHENWYADDFCSYGERRYDNATD